MNKNEKINFIESILENTKKDILDQIDKIPEEWDGRQLRQYITAYANDNILWIKLDQKQKREYKNDVIINNLK